MTKESLVFKTDYKMLNKHFKTESYKILMHHFQTIENTLIILKENHLTKIKTPYWLINELEKINDDRCRELNNMKKELDK